MIKRKFHLDLGEPTIVVRGQQCNHGPWQFPKLARTKNGSIYIKWSMGTDRVEGGGDLLGQSQAISDDRGKTWKLMPPDDSVAYDTMMPNGKAFAYFLGKAAHEVNYDLKQYTVACDGRENTSVYFADDIKELDRTTIAVEYDTKTGELNQFPVKINWPNMALTVYHRDYGDIVYPPCQMMAISNGEGQLVLDDGLYFCTYSRGFDFKTGKITKHSGRYSVYVFRSIDSARTWDIVSQVLVDDDTYRTRENDPIDSEGLCEPKMRKMLDGSVVMIMRSGLNYPTWLVRSTDNCKTWSKPVEFDDIGVFPQMVCLDCGVTVATYGRPEMRIRATADPQGLKWEPPIKMELNPAGKNRPWWWQSCFNTSLLALDGNSVLMAYSDFNVPNEEGEPTKSIMVRNITVVFDE